MSSPTLFTQDTLGTVLACRRPRGLSHAGKLDDTLRSAAALAEAGNLVARELARELGAKGFKIPRFTARGVLEAAHHRRRTPEECAEAAELVKVLERRLPGTPERAGLRLVGRGFQRPKE